MPWTCTSTASGSCYCCWQVRLQHPCCSPPPTVLSSLTPLSLQQKPQAEDGSSFTLRYSMRWESECVWSVRSFYSARVSSLGPL